MTHQSAGTRGQGPVPADGARVACRDGVTSVTTGCENDRDEAVTATRWLVAAHAAGCRWRDVLVVAPGKRKWRDRLAAALEAASVPYRMLLGEPGALPGDGDVVHVASLYGARGLSFPQVAIVGLGDLPWKQQPLDEALEVTAAACRVATRDLHLSWSRPSALVDRVFPQDDATSRGSDARTRG